MRPTIRIFLVVVVLAGIAGGAWWQRQLLLTQYYLLRLDRAAETDRSTWVKALVAVGPSARSSWVGLLSHTDATTCDAIRPTLIEQAPDWPTLASDLAVHFPQASPAGRRVSLEVLATLPMNSDLAVVCRSVVEQSLKQSEGEVRVAAVRLAMRPGVDFLPALVPFLDDELPEVRRAAMLAIGPRRDLVADDDLLRWTHDPDSETARLCRIALRSRGLREKDVRMGHAVTSPRFLDRLSVIAELGNDPDIDPSVWLQRLSHDPEPAVRAAAVRAGVALPVNLEPRWQEMANDDPDPTVRQLASYYQQHQLPNEIRRTAGP